MTDLPKTEYRKRCLREKDEECSSCGSAENIVVHHIDGDRTNNDLDNLTPLCGDCHRKVHSGHPDVADLVEALGKHVSGGGGTNIQVTGEVWKELNSRKSPGQSFDDVIAQIIGFDGNEQGKPQGLTSGKAGSSDAKN